jgi:hypothetical protein
MSRDLFVGEAEKSGRVVVENVSLLVLGQKGAMFENRDGDVY